MGINFNPQNQNELVNIRKNNTDNGVNSKVDYKATLTRKDASGHTSKITYVTTMDIDTFIVYCTIEHNGDVCKTTHSTIVSANKPDTGKTSGLSAEVQDVLKEQSNAKLPNMRKQ